MTCGLGASAPTRQRPDPQPVQPRLEQSLERDLGARAVDDRVEKPPGPRERGATAVLRERAEEQTVVVAHGLVDLGMAALRLCVEAAAVEPPAGADPPRGPGHGPPSPPGGGHPQGPVLL